MRKTIGTILLAILGVGSVFTFQNCSKGGGAPGDLGGPGPGPKGTQLASVRFVHLSEDQESIRSFEIDFHHAASATVTDDEKSVDDCRLSKTIGFEEIAALVKVFNGLAYQKVLASDAGSMEGETAYIELLYSTNPEPLRLYFTKDTAPVGSNLIVQNGDETVAALDEVYENQNFKPYCLETDWATVEYIRFYRGGGSVGQGEPAYTHDFKLFLSDAVIHKKKTTKCYDKLQATAANVTGLKTLIDSKASRKKLSSEPVIADMHRQTIELSMKDGKKKVVYLDMEPAPVGKLVFVDATTDLANNLKALVDGRTPLQTICE